MSWSFPNQIHQHVSVCFSYSFRDLLGKSINFSLIRAGGTLHERRGKQRELDRINDWSLCILRSIVWTARTWRDMRLLSWRFDLISVGRSAMSRDARRYVFYSEPENAAHPNVRTLSRRAEGPPTPGGSSSETEKHRR